MGLILLSDPNTIPRPKEYKISPTTPGAEQDRNGNYVTYLWGPGRSLNICLYMYTYVHLIIHSSIHLLYLLAHIYNFITACIYVCSYIYSYSPNTTLYAATGYQNYHVCSFLLYSPI